MCVCGSKKPGRTTLSVASNVDLADPTRFSPSATMRLGNRDVGLDLSDARNDEHSVANKEIEFGRGSRRRHVIKSAPGYGDRACGP